MFRNYSGEQRKYSTGTAETIERLKPPITGTAIYSIGYHEVRS